MRPFDPLSIFNTKALILIRGDWKWWRWHRANAPSIIKRKKVVAEWPTVAAWESCQGMFSFDNAGRFCAQLIDAALAGATLCYDMCKCRAWLCLPTFRML